MDNINVSNLLSTKMCSPMIIFTVIVVVFGISLFNTRSTLKKFNSTKMDNLFNVYSWHEIKMIIVLGIILFGLCQYNQVNLAGYLCFPSYLFNGKNLMIFIFVIRSSKCSKTEKMMQNYGVTPACNKLCNHSSSTQLIKQLISQPDTSTPIQNLAGPMVSGSYEMNMPLSQLVELVKFRILVSFKYKI